MTVVFSERYPARASSCRWPDTPSSTPLPRQGFRILTSTPGTHQALSEATGNVVRHAYPHGGNGHMDVVVNEAAGAVIIAVTDQGVGMNHTDTRTELTSMGLGLPTMRALTSSVQIESDTNGTIVTLHFESS